MTTNPSITYLLAIILFLLSIVNLYAQETSRVFVKSDGNSIQVKWYGQDLWHKDGVDIYRSTNGGAFEKLNNQPITMQAAIPEDELRRDEDLEAYSEIAKSLKEGDEEDNFLLLNLYIKSFESKAFSEFLGIMYTDNAVQPGITFQYKIITLADQNELNITDHVQLAKPKIGAAVKGFNISQKRKRAEFWWQPEDERYFGVYLYKQTNNGQFLKVNDRPVIQANLDNPDRNPKLMLKDDSVSIGNTYKYYITGIDFFGDETLPSDTLTFKPGDTSPPPPPTLKLVNIRKQKVSLNWAQKTIDDLGAFTLYRSVRSDGPFERIDKLSKNTLQYTDSVAPGRYYYKVSSVDQSGNASPSNPVYAEVPDHVPPAPPQQVQALSDTGKVILKWQANAEKDLQGYLIYRAINDKSQFTLINATPIKSTTFTHKMAKNVRTKQYYYVVATDSSFNNSKPSEHVSIQLPDVTPPAKPFISEAYHKNDTTYINWLPSNDADLAKFQLSTSADKEKWNTLPLPITATDLSAKYKSGVTTYYRIEAIDSIGNISEPSNIMKVVVPISGAITTPQFTKLKVNKRKPSVRLSWSVVKSDHLKGYVVFRLSPKSKALEPISGLLSSGSLEDTDVTEGLEYSYQVRGYSTTGEVSKSEVAKVMLK